MTGRAWQEDGTLSARYWSEAAKERRDPAGIFYFWKGERPRHPDAPQLEGTGEIRLETVDRATGYWTTRSDRDAGLNARTAGIYLRADPSDLQLLDRGSEEERARLHRAASPRVEVRRELVRTVAVISAHRECAAVIDPATGVMAAGVDPALLVLATAAGSNTLTYINDASFWLFKGYFDLSVKESRTWGLLELCHRWSVWARSSSSTCSSSRRRAQDAPSPNKRDRTGSSGILSRTPLRGAATKGVGPDPSPT